MRPKKLTLGVLSPYLGGWYYGGLLTSITRATADAGGTVIAIQTLDPGTDQIEVVQPPVLGHPIARDHADGFIALTNAVEAGYLAKLQDIGKPVVVVSHEFPDLRAPLVLPDNATGVRAAINHLVEHGHRRIAFVGWLGADDVRDRYAAYQQALRAHGITPEPGWLFESTDNHQTGGERAGQRMADAGMPCTATFVATDANAAGLMRRLTNAGYRLPDDQFLIGFDDLEASAYLVPPLTTVRQPIDQLGRTAVAALLERVNGGGSDTARHLVPTSLVVRETCGCTPARRRGDATGTERPRIGSDVVTRPRGVDVIGRLSHYGGDGLVPEVLDDVRRAVTDLLGDGTLPDGQVEGVVDRVGATVCDALRRQGRAQFVESSYLQATLSQQYEVSMDLIRGHEEDPRQLSWLSRTTAAAGCLGLWSRPAPVRSIEIAGSYPRPRLRAVAPARPAPASSFPPPHLLRLATQRREDAVFVVPVKSKDSDWGLLAIVDTVDTQLATAREPINQWSALLAAALDHQATVEELHRQEEQLRVAALYDHLTGLPNRTLFLERLDRAIRQGRRRTDDLFGVLFLDLDGFKVINDSLGHSAGDRLLVEVARRVGAGLRRCDTAARFGGDEFLILLEEVTDPNTPARVAERLHASLAEPFDLDGQLVVVGASIGIAMSSARYENAEDLLRDADIAMYWAKSQRRGSHAVFDVAMHDKAVHRLQVETELRQALERDEFEVAYQPIVELTSGRAHIMEGLARWRHPTRGTLTTEDFLPVAEESGVILPLGRWVLNRACHQLAAWQDAGAPADLRIGLNVSNRQFWHERLLPVIEEELDDTGIDPSQLVLDITESVVTFNIERAMARLADLRALGCQIHIDDFGTGHFSLEALHRLPIDALKIDNSFIARLDTDPRSRELVRNIVVMADNLDLALIAEGIETPAQRDLLVELGCRYGQGYLLGRPSCTADLPRPVAPVARAGGPASTVDAAVSLERGLSAS